MVVWFRGKEGVKFVVEGSRVDSFLIVLSFRLGMYFLFRRLEVGGRWGMIFFWVI